MCAKAILEGVGGEGEEREGVTQEMVLRERHFQTWHLSVQKDLIAILKTTAIKLSL